MGITIPAPMRTFDPKFIAEARDRAHLEEARISKNKMLDILFYFDQDI